MTRCFDRPILNLLGHTIVEVMTGGSFLRKVWMMPCIRLDADAPAALGHAKDEGPAVLRVKVGVRQDEQALVVPQPQILL